MRSMTSKQAWWALCAVAAGTALFLSSSARATIGSDSSGAILVFPKIIVDTSGQLFGSPTDTEIQITNTSNSVIAARCYWVNATSHCSNDPTRACRPETVQTNCGTGARCVEGWAETDFRFTLTKRQPISFNAADGLPTFPLSQQQGPGGQSNGTSSIPPVPEDPFIGELKCVQVDPTDFRPTIGFNPANNAGGDLAGHATIISALGDPSQLDARKYNAVTLKSTTVNDNDDVLILGGPNAEYDGCPNVWILNHFFDGARIPTRFVNGSPTADPAEFVTDLTVVPCSQDFLLQENNLGGAVLQFLVFNEFEQRFSSSTRFTCFREVRLSDLDTRPGPGDNNFSIFNVNVQGTLSGQTRIRSVVSNGRANGIIAVAERFSPTEGLPVTSAENVHFTGSRPDLEDRIVLSPDTP